MRGPGGLYNVGNVLGLAAGIAVQFFSGAADATFGTAALAYLVGSGGGLALTIATFIFILSGEAYHRAWAHGAPPDRRMNWYGDLLSGLGAIALGIGLLLLGQPVLAATSGLLHACGKFASAFHRPRSPSEENWTYLFRVSVLASRIPGFLAAAFVMLHALSPDSHDGIAEGIVAPLSLMICYALWAKADILLFPARPYGLRR